MWILPCVGATISVLSEQWSFSLFLKQLPNRTPQVGAPRSPALTVVVVNSWHLCHLEKGEGVQTSTLFYARGGTGLYLCIIVIHQVTWWDLLPPFVLHRGAAVSGHNIQPCFLPCECILHGPVDVLLGTNLQGWERGARRWAQKGWWEREDYWACCSPVCWVGTAAGAWWKESCVEQARSWAAHRQRKMH